MSIEWGNLCRMPNMTFGEFIFYSAVHRGSTLMHDELSAISFQQEQKAEG
jgi:hypothetical protein